MQAHVKEIECLAHIRSTSLYQFEKIGALPVQAQAIPLALRVRLTLLQGLNGLQYNPDVSC